MFVYFYDKPPLVYWLMGIGFSIPGSISWDPLGTWAARLPSALSTIFLMLILGDTMMKYPQEENNFNRRTAVVTSLVFALSPLVIIWGRIAVSDALLCSTLGICLLFKISKSLISFETKLLKTNHLISTWRLVVNARENRLSSLKNNKRSNNER